MTFTKVELSYPMKLGVLSPTQILEQMLALFGDGEGWTTDVPARDPQGRHCHYLADEARSFCLMGAAFKVTEARWGLHSDAALTALARVAKTVGVPFPAMGETGREKIAEWNNSRLNYGEVKAALLAALEDGK